MTDNVISILKKSLDASLDKSIKVDTITPLSDSEIEDFKDILKRSMSEFNCLSIMDKHSLYVANTELLLFLIDLIHNGK